MIGYTYKYLNPFHPVRNSNSHFEYIYILKKKIKIVSEDLSKTTVKNKGFWFLNLIYCRKLFKFETSQQFSY